MNHARIALGQLSYRDYSLDIPVGKENAISRAALAQKWRCTDRVARDIVASLRALDNGDDYIIISSSWNGTRGYYRTDDPVAIRRYIGETRARATSTFKPLKKAQRVLRKMCAEGEPQQASMTCNLRQLRVAHELTQDEFVSMMAARCAGFDRMALSKAENGHVMLTPRQQIAAAMLLCCDVSDIYPLAENSPPIKKGVPL